jgi:hypothetical protein
LSKDQKKEDSMHQSGEDEGEKGNKEGGQEKKKGTPGTNVYQSLPCHARALIIDLTSLLSS